MSGKDCPIPLRFIGPTGRFIAALFKPLPILNLTLIPLQELPHGSSRNHGSYPRVAQYITMNPPDFPHNPVWK